MRNYPKLSVKLQQSETYEIYDSDIQKEPLYHVSIETNNNNQFDAIYILIHYNLGSEVEMNLTLDDLESIGEQLISIVKNV